MNVLPHDPQLAKRAAQSHTPSRVTSPATLARDNLPYVALAVLLSLILSHIPIVGLVVFPFRLMATFVHESSHAIVATVTGGQVVKMVINSDLSGDTWVRGGAGLLVDSAGYVGTAAAGALLVLVPVRNARTTLWVLAALAVMAVVAFHVSLYTAFWGGIFAALCGVVAARGTPRVAAFLQSFIAVQLGLNAIAALQVLSAYTVDGGGPTDATIAAQSSPFPAIFWTVLWSAIAIVALVGAVWHIAAPSVWPRLPGGKRRPLL